MKTIAYSYTRFSSMEQSSGDSRRRQDQFIQNYVEKHGLELDTSLTLHDAGVSAFRGKNAKSGALKLFLDSIESGLVQAGSVLLVESLDRVSRMAPLDALPIFLQIINAGVTIITLMDNMVHSRESIEQTPMSLIMSILTMVRAHEESKVKSERLSQVWQQKRVTVTDRKLTGKCPAWMKLSDDKTSFELIDYRVAIVEEIFSMSLKGYGTRRIANKFNEAGLDTFGNGIGWQQTYIRKILKSRAVIGEYQPMKFDGTKRVAAGEMIYDYFPAIIDEQVFNQVQKALSGRLGASGNMQNFQPLFKQLLKCNCGANIHVKNKGAGKRYYVCSHSLLKKCENDLLLNVDRIDYCILNALEQLDFTSVVQYENKVAANAVDEIDALKKLISINKNKTDNLVNAIAEFGFNEALQNSLHKFTSEKNELEQKLKQLESDMPVVDIENVNNFTAALYKLIEKFNDSETRLIASTHIKKFVSKIIVNYYGEKGARIELKSGQSLRVELKEFDADWFKRYREAVTKIEKQEL